MHATGRISGMVGPVAALKPAQLGSGKDRVGERLGLVRQPSPAQKRPSGVVMLGPGDRHDPTGKDQFLTIVEIRTNCNRRCC
jgi:hypothetical protein